MHWCTGWCSGAPAPCSAPPPGRPQRSPPPPPGRPPPAAGAWAGGAGAFNKGADCIATTRAGTGLAGSCSSCAPQHPQLLLVDGHLTIAPAWDPPPAPARAPSSQRTAHLLAQHSVAERVLDEARHGATQRARSVLLAVPLGHNLGQHAVGDLASEKSGAGGGPGWVCRLAGVEGEQWRCAQRWLMTGLCWFATRTPGPHHPHTSSAMRCSCHVCPAGIATSFPSHHHNTHTHTHNTNTTHPPPG